MDLSNFINQLQKGQLKEVIIYDDLPLIKKEYDIHYPQHSIISLCRVVEVILCIALFFGWGLFPWKWYITAPIAFLCLIPVSYYKESLQEQAARYVLIQAMSNETLYIQLLTRGYIKADLSAHYMQS